MIIRPSYLYTFLGMSNCSFGAPLSNKHLEPHWQFTGCGWGEVIFALPVYGNFPIVSLPYTQHHLLIFTTPSIDDAVVHQIYSLYLSGQRPVKKLFSSDVFCNTFCQSRHTKEATDTLYCTSRQYVQFLTGWFFFVIYFFFIYFNIFFDCQVFWRPYFLH